MKKIFFGVIFLAIAGIYANAQVAPKPKTAAKPKTASTAPVALALKSPADSFSYALGLAIGDNLQQQGIDDVNYSIVLKAMEDVAKKRKPLFDQKQANTVIQKKMQEYADEKLAKTKAEGKAFLADNGKRPGVITLPDGLEYEVIKKSDSASASPTEKDTVVANYKGTLIDGTEFDESYKRGEPLTIGVNSVIKGWTEVLQLMHPGDIWKVYIPSELAYGDRGAGQQIPGGSTLIFQLELLAVKTAVTK